MNGRIIDRGVLVEDPDGKTLGANQQLRRDNLSLEPHRRRAWSSGAGVSASAAGGKKERRAQQKRNRPRLTPAEKFSAGRPQETASTKWARHTAVLMTRIEPAAEVSQCDGDGGWEFTRSPRI